MTEEQLEKLFLKARQDFPMLKKTMRGHPLVYLDSAATSQKPQAVIDAICDFYQNRYGTVHRAVYELAAYASEAYQQVREVCRAFLNAAKPEEIIFTRGTTESINMVAYSFGKAFVRQGDEIIISALEHHSNIVPWQILCEDRGAVLRVIPVKDDGSLDMDAYSKLLTEKTRLVAVAHASNAIGTIHPIKKMIRMAHAAGAKVLVDGAQAAPSMPIDVQDLDADFYVFSAHKICGPTGIGVLYGKESLLEAMPPYQGGGDMIETVTFEKTTYNTLPLKFEAGTPMIAEVIGLGAAIGYLSRLGMQNIYAWKQILLKEGAAALQDIPGLRIIGGVKEKVSLISFVVDGVHHLDIGTLLDLKGIAVRTGHHCAQPAMARYGLTGTSRVSFFFYNTKEEIRYFGKSLRMTINELK